MNALIRFRAPPEVHAAKADLDARGVSVSGLLSKAILDAAQEHNAILRHAAERGLETRPVRELPDQDAIMFQIVTDGYGEPPTATDRVVLAFTMPHRTGQWLASATRITHGDERIAIGGVSVPDDVVDAAAWIDFAERLTVGRP